MSLLVALILGVVQGLTEFIPVSSSGHLILVPWLLGVETPSLAFATALHLGTLIGLVAALRPQILLVLRTVTRWKAATPHERLLVTLLAYGTIPAVIVGLGAEAVIGDAFERPVLAGFMLIITGYLLTSTETRVAASGTDPDRTNITARDAWLIGAAQAVAIVPGISRSGSTIATGVRLGLSRDAAARFSFLLSVPVIAGAVVLELPAMVSEGALGEDAGAFAVGVVAAAVSGWWALRWFVGIIGRVGLRGFGRYCWVAAAGTLLVAMARG